MPEPNAPLEKRSYPRVPVKVPVKYHLVEKGDWVLSLEEWQGAERNAHTTNIGLDGMHLVVDQPLAIGNTHRFNLFLLDETDVLVVYAQVVWANDAEAGLCFVKMDVEKIRLLKRFLEKVNR